MIATRAIKPPSFTLMNRDGTNSHSLSDKLDRDIQDPQWAADNSGVYVRYDDQATPRSVFIPSMALPRKLPIILPPRRVLVVAATFSLSRTGLIALTYGRTDNPGDIAISNNGAMKVLTALNQELLAQEKPATSTSSRSNSSKDNRKIQGWIVHPRISILPRNILLFLKFTAALSPIMRTVSILKNRSWPPRATWFFI